MESLSTCGVFDSSPGEVIGDKVSLSGRGAVDTIGSIGGRDIMASNAAAAADTTAGTAAGDATGASDSFTAAALERAGSAACWVGRSDDFMIWMNID